MEPFESHATTHFSSQQVFVDEFLSSAAFNDVDIDFVLKFKKYQFRVGFMNSSSQQSDDKSARVELAYYEKAFSSFKFTRKKFPLLSSKNR